jgi:hypothetical protein
MVSDLKAEIHGLNFGVYSQIIIQPELCEIMRRKSPPSRACESTKLPIGDRLIWQAGLALPHLLQRSASHLEFDVLFLFLIARYFATSEARGSRSDG